MKTLAKTLTLALATAGLAGTAITPAFAGTGTGAARGAPLTAQVNFDDLDLGTAAGQRTLDKRVEKAVRQVCRTVNIKTGTRTMGHETIRCMARARSDAKQQLAAITSDAQRGG